MSGIIIIGIVVIIVILLFSRKKTKPVYPVETYPISPKKNGYAVKNERTDRILQRIKITEKSLVSSISGPDDSIIDVTGKSYTIPAPGGLKKYNAGIPYWEHQYVYTYNEIYSATKIQQQFYQVFRNAFLNREYYDLEGNNNYAFILLFELQHLYNTGKNPQETAHNIISLGMYYPKTAFYGKTFLAEKTGAVTQHMKNTLVSSQHEAQETYDEWKLGNKYRKKLNLSPEEVKLLNKVGYSGNNFFQIPFCSLEILKLFLRLSDALNKEFTREGLTITQQFDEVSDIIVRKQFKYKQGSSNYMYSIQSVSNECYNMVFKYCENAVREHYGHKRKISTEFYYNHPEAKMAFEEKIIHKVTALLPNLINTVKKPDEATEITLYAQNTTRWKTRYEEITRQYQQDVPGFLAAIIELGRLNRQNPSVENIFFEASKYIAKTDKETALYLYIYYLHYDLQSVVFDHKKLTKTLQKSLFKTNEQLHAFEMIVGDFIRDKDLEKALRSVPKVYTAKRKKIQLDKTSIREVQEQHSGTVELLNEYLKDSYEDEMTSIKTQECNLEEVEMEITRKAPLEEISLYIPEIHFTPVQKEALDIFVKNNLSVSHSDFEIFAKSKGVFKNPLIDSINEVCYELLDDVFIEDEEIFYTINEFYYQKILAT